ncbi:hypothetical protein K2X96_02580 [Patescibacteria group bacterium]|nr:hypothetical protein [Patescibacteria group bacterium]
MISSNTTHSIFLGLIFCAFLILGGNQASAQTTSLGGQAAAIELSPLNVTAGANFTARLGDYSGTLGSGDISWYINGVLQPDKKNQMAIVLVAPAFGEPMKIEVSRGGGKISTIVVPQEIDIITEGTSMAPYFYQGRATPSIGTRARITAAPRMFYANGTPVPPSDVLYSWNVDDKIIENGGRPVLDLVLPIFGSPLVLLSATSRDGSATYEKTFYIETEEPSLQFYTYSPLTGLSRNAIQDSYYQTTNEVTLRAQPYSIDSTVYNNAEYGWTIDGGRVNNTTSDPQVITLQKSGSGGVSTIGFSLRNLAVLSQYAENTFRVDFK